MNENIKDIRIEERFFQKNNFAELEDYIIVGDEGMSVGVPRKASVNLKKRILAAIKAEQLGCISTDYIYKRYASSWRFNDYADDNEKLFVEIINCVRTEVGNMLIRIRDADKVNTIGLTVARAVLYRLQNSFKSVLLLIKKRHIVEALNLCRLILEQIAWAYHIHLLDEEEFIKTKTTDSISRLKGFYKTAGRIYGELSKNVHISPELTPEYITIDEYKCEITLSNIKDISYSLFCILLLTDIYCCTSEIILKEFIGEFQYLNKDNNNIDSDRQFKKTIQLFNNKLSKI